MGLRHFLTLSDLSTQELHVLIERGIEIKSAMQKGELYQPLQGKVLAMIFEKSSTRTRVSFEVGMAQFGGHAIFMSPEGTQLGRGEPIEDTARVLSKMVDGIMIRTFEQEKIKCLAKYASVPIINGLSDTYHPCQLLADMQTYYEHRGSIEGKTVAWLGDGNNMCHSYINAALRLGFKLNVGCPSGHEPDAKLLETAGDRVKVFNTAEEAASGADLIVTDVWASMGQEDEQQQRLQSFADYQVNSALMQAAQSEALFMHCLPAHRDEEVSTEVLESPQSVVWQEAENRLHAQKALLEFLLAGSI